MLPDSLLAQILLYLDKGSIQDFDLGQAVEHQKQKHGSAAGAESMAVEYGEECGAGVSKY